MHITRCPYFIFFLIPIVCAFPSFIHGQSKSFDERYDELYLKIMASDTHHEAVRIADSMVSVAKTDLQRMKALVLSANLQHILGKIPTAIDQVLKAQNIANRGKHAEWQARTAGFLASTFRNAGVLEESQKHLMQAEIANERQKNSPSYFLTKANILQEKAFHAVHDSAYHQALDYLNEGTKYILKDTANQAQAILVTVTNDHLKATSYLQIGKLALADSLLTSSLPKLWEDESNLRLYIYTTKAELALVRGQYDTAYHYLRLAKPPIEPSNKEELKERLYNTLSKYYQAIGNNEQAVYYHEKYRKVFNERERTARQISNSLIKRLNEENQRYHNDVQKGWWYFSAVLLAMALTLIFLYLKRRKDKRSYIVLINFLKEKSETAVLEKQLIETEIDDNGHSRDEPKLLISDDTEKRLIEELQVLEKQHFYLDKDLSLSSLANQLNTNQRYVSYAIRKYKDMDFHTYIHHCRIHYITHRLKNEPELLDYKLSYLAEITGFSSHSKFSAVFKSVTGISPSTFVQYTKETNGGKLEIELP